MENLTIVRTPETSEYLKYLNSKTDNQYDPVIQSHLERLRYLAIRNNHSLSDYLLYITREKFPSGVYNLPDLKELDLDNRKICSAVNQFLDYDKRHFNLLEQLLHHPELKQVFSKSFLFQLLDKYQFDEQIFYRLIYTKRWLIYHCYQIFEENFSRFDNQERVAFMLNKILYSTNHLAADGEYYSFEDLMNNFCDNQTTVINDHKNFFLTSNDLYKLYLESKDPQLFFEVTPAVFFLDVDYNDDPYYSERVCNIRIFLEKLYNPDVYSDSAIIRRWVTVVDFDISFDDQQDYD